MILQWLKDGWRKSKLKRRQTPTAWSTQQCMKSGVAKHLGVAGIQQQNRLVDETNVTLFAKVRCFLIQFGLSMVFWAEDTTMSTYLVNRSPSSAIRFKKPIDMLGFFGWLASIKQWMLKPVKVKCIFLGYHKSIVGNNLWRLDDVTLKVVLYRNMGFNESGEYKKTLIESGVGTGSMQVLHGFEFEVEPLRDHTFEVEPQENVDQGAEDSNEAAFTVAAVEKIEKAVTTATAIIGSMHQAESGLPRVCWLKQREIYLVWRSSGIRVDSLSGDYDVKKNGKLSYIYAVGSQEYQVACTRPGITSTSVDMLDGFDHGLQTNVQVFVDFDYAMGRSINVMSRSIKRYGLMILGCAGSLKANLQRMEALSTTEAGYMTFTEPWKKEIWLKGLLTESGYELRLVAGIAIGALVKGGSRSKVPAQVEVVAYRY
ncbi:zinc finger, CCHC-type containing protein [Tanacetum coccineum]